MNWKLLIPAVVLALASLGAAWKLGWLDPLTDRSNGAISACEAVTMQSLRAPSTYKLIWADYTPMAPLSSEEHRELSGASSSQNSNSEAQRYYDAYAKKMDKDIERKLRLKIKLDDVEQAIVDNRASMDAAAARNAPEARTAFVTLEYDAENGFGAPIRSFAGCRFSAIGVDGHFGESDILLAGPIDEAAGRETKILAERRPN